MLLGSLPGHSDAVLDGLGPQKLKKHVFFQGFCKCTIFGIREVMLGFLGASWRSWADSGLKLTPKNNSQTGPELVQKVVQNWSNFLYCFWLCFYRFRDARRCPCGARRCPGGARRSTLSEEVPRAASREVL